MARTIPRHGTPGPAVRDVPEPRLGVVRARCGRRGTRAARAASAHRRDLRPRAREPRAHRTKVGTECPNARPRSRWLRLLMPIAVAGARSSPPAAAGVVRPLDRRQLRRRRGQAAPSPRPPRPRRPPPKLQRRTSSASRRQDGTGQAPSAPRDDLKIVYTGSLELVVDDLAGRARQGQDRRPRHRRLHRRLAGGQRRRPLRRHHHLPHPGHALGGRPRRRCAASRPRSWASRPRRPRWAARSWTSRPGSGTCGPASRSSWTSPRAPARSPTCSRSRRASREVRGQIEQLDGQRLQLAGPGRLRDARRHLRHGGRAGPGGRQGLGSEVRR